MGRLIEFYHPQPKPAQEAPVEEPEISAADILKQCLANSDSIAQVIVMTADKNGVLGFLGNCDGLAESLLFMDLVKAQALFTRIEGPSGGSTAS